MSSQSNITTLNQLVNNFSEIARLHEMINRFEYGNPTDYYQSGTTNSPEMWMHCDNITRHHQGVSDCVCTITLADEVMRNSVNELEVESDLVQIADDVCAQCQIKAANYGWAVQKDSPVSYRIFTEDRKTPKNMKLLQFQITIRIKKDANQCAIPFTQQPI